MSQNKEKREGGSQMRDRQKGTWGLCAGCWAPGETFAPKEGSKGGNEGISAGNCGEESSSSGRDPGSERRVDGNRVGPAVGSPRGMRRA